MDKSWPIKCHINL